ncbi:maleylpyruvate isomerase family mycothiol-dependent enzyme [Fodinicola feengrottensis]|uniref:Maleylpyruvate isomerase family mycothiol-dependent enzyme n=1 Tax=Fodinicola feengrottensis TaxID=435914 RepID=A0ABP4U326_9ACTN|nr:maleylpyruvate isomerase family mycothiol-dependent enzyme [Fodinicola feengrottensis]
MTDLTADQRFWLEALRAEGAALGAAVGVENLAAPVRSCPGWNLERLVGHLGVVYQFQRTHFVRGTASRPDNERQTAPTGPAVLDYFAEQLAQTITALENLDPEAPAWNWGGGPKVAAFWFRRMALETAIHRWDAQAAIGIPIPLDPRLSVDGIAEVLDTQLPSGRRKGPDDAEGVVRLNATDTGDRWVLRLRGTTLAVLDTNTVLDPGPGAQAAAKGTASDLLLALWGRIPLDVLEITGESHLLEALRTG